MQSSRAGSWCPDYLPLLLLTNMIVCLLMYFNALNIDFYCSLSKDIFRQASGCKSRCIYFPLNNLKFINNTCIKFLI